MAASQADASSLDGGPSRTSRSVFTATGAWPQAALANITPARNKHAERVFIRARECSHPPPPRNALGKANRHGVATVLRACCERVGPLYIPYLSLVHPLYMWTAKVNVGLRAARGSPAIWPVVSCGESGARHGPGIR